MLDFRHFLRELTRSGLTESTDASLAKHMVITHQMTLTWIPLVAIFMVMFYLAGAQVFAQAMGVLLATHFLVFLLSKRGFFTLTRILEIIVPVTAVQIGVAFDFPQDIHIRSIFSMYIVSFSAIPFLFFALSEIKPLVFCVLWIVAVWVSYDTINLSYGSVAAPALLESKMFYYYTGGSALLLLFSSILFFKTSNTKYEKTIELLMAQTELQNKEIMQQSTELFAQNKDLLQQRKNALHSLQYASHIQQIVFPDQFAEALFIQDSFVLHRPRDTVSGDFFWYKELDQQIVVCVADCTGHGVPGALTSMLAASMLNDLVSDDTVCSVADFLNELNQKVSRMLSPKDNELLYYHGLDIALLAISKDGKSAEFASARNALYLLRKGTLTEIKGNKASIGIGSEEVVFSDISMDIKTGDQLYMFTDGYADQLNGANGSKIKRRTLKSLLCKHADRSMVEQKRYLESYLDAWQADYEQVDDILGVGIKL